MKDYLSKGAFEDLFIDLYMIYDGRAHLAYELLKRECEEISNNPPEDFGESEFKFLDSLINSTLDESLKKWSASWLERREAEKGNKKIVIPFKGKPEILAATIFFIEFLTDERKSSIRVDRKVGYEFPVIMECKFVSILFENFFNVCDLLERAGIHAPHGWRYSTWLVRLGTVIEIDIFKYFPDLGLKDALGRLSRDGKKAAQFKTKYKEKRIRKFCEEFLKKVKPDKKNVVHMRRDEYEKMLAKHHSTGNKEGVPRGSTKKKYRDTAKAYLKEKYEREIKIRITKK